MEIRITPWGPLPDWYDEQIQTESNNEDWARRANNWRIMEEVPQTMQNFFNVFCKKGLKVFDHGSGNGRSLLLIAKTGAEAYGIDCSSEMNEVAEQRLKEAGLTANIQKKTYFEMDFPKNYFDLAVSSQSLQLPGCWSKIKEAFDKLTQVVKPGGYLYLRVRSINSPDRPDRQYFDDLYGDDEGKIVNKGTNIRNYRTRRDPNGQFRHNYSEEEIMYLAHLYGMDVAGGGIIEEWNDSAIDGQGRPSGHGTFQWRSLMRKK